MQPSDSNHELIRKGLDLLREALKPFIEKEMRDVYGDAWEQESRNALGTPSYTKLNWDAQALLKVIDRRWNEVFRKKLEKRKHRAWVVEARELRDDFAHQKSFHDEDTLRGLDTIECLLAAVSASEIREVALLKSAIGDRPPAPHAGGMVREYATRASAEQSRSEIESQFKYLPIYLVPSDAVIFKQQLLQSRVAEIVTTYSDGRVETKIWRAANFSASSNVIGNLRSRPKYRAGNWQAQGIVKISVRVLENARHRSSHSVRPVTDRTCVPDNMSAEERMLVIRRVQGWASKPHLNVHRIIAIVVRSSGGVSRDELVNEAARITNTKNAYGAVASLLTSKSNAYGRVLEDVGGIIRLHPAVEPEVRSFRWSY
jgi:hypothetical protein